MSDSHFFKTIETLLTIADVIPHPPAAPLTYQEITDRVISRGTTTNYSSVRRMLQNQRLQALLNFTVKTQSSPHSVQYLGGYFDQFSHGGLVAYLSMKYLGNLLPMQVRERFKRTVANYLDRYQNLDVAYPDKGWKNKLIIQRDALGGWLLEDLPIQIDEIFSALYFGRQLELEALSAKRSNEKQTMIITPIRLSIDTRECRLIYREDTNSANKEKSLLNTEQSISIEQIVRARMLIEPY
ncbi:hypothetical protein [Vibrio algivorus]|uniref:WYL domain-containing protein n=1 Tax=Vibrio algivorus TaxID=1667024 RepID=A0A557P5H3_9VIBR|nr:hypothetical protein [Vibrio algivorus]TVO35894.1 hypothetical protein FOF44_10910 [Vibrio algivorus]